MSMTVAVQAAPAWAGGVGSALSPVFGSKCATPHEDRHTTHAEYAVPGSAASNVLQLPDAAPFNQCGETLTPVGLIDGFAG